MQSVSPPPPQPWPPVSRCGTRRCSLWARWRCLAMSRLWWSATSISRWGFPGALAITGVLILGLAAVTARLMRATHPPKPEEPGAAAPSYLTHPLKPKSQARRSHHTGIFPRPCRQAEPPCASGDSRCWEDRSHGMSVGSLARAVGPGRLADPDASDREPLHRRDVAAGVRHNGDHLAGCGVERNSE